MGCSTLEKKELSEVNEIYTCEQGRTVNLSYLKKAAGKSNITLKSVGVHYNLSAIETASGAKYSDGIYTWWSKGEQATLYIDGISMLKNCRLNS